MKTKFAAAFVIVALVLSGVPSISAADFGSQIKSTDSDFVTGTGAASIVPKVLRKEFGVANDVTDDAFYFDVDNNGVVSNYDVRLTAYGGKSPGTLVTDSDTTEKGAAVVGGDQKVGYAIVASTLLKTYDKAPAGGEDLVDSYYFKGVGKTATWVEDGDIRMYDSALAAGTVAATNIDDDRELTAAAILKNTGASEYYFDHAGGGLLDGTGAAGASDQRLTAVVTAPGYAAGTYLTCAGDADCGNAVAAVANGAQFGTTAPPTYAANAWYQDVNANGHIDSGDLRIADQPGGLTALATVAATDADSVRALAAVSGAVKFYDFVPAGESSDDYFYKDVDSNGRVSAGDLRIKAALAAGTVAATDADATAVTLSNAKFRYADVNNNGRYDGGDIVYFTTVATGLASSAGTEFTIRLTAGGGKGAGTLVLASDSDFTAYKTSAVAFTPSIAWFDADLSAGGAFTTGDSLYLVPQTGLAAGSLFPLHSLRMTSGNTAGGFGSQLLLGNADYVPTSSTSGTLAFTGGRVVRLELGVGGDIKDDCLLIDADADGIVENFDIRLTPCSGKAAGTRIGDSDTTEKSATVVAALANSNAVFADVNNNGRYDNGDSAYFVARTAAGTTLLAPNGALTTYSVRLTPAASYAAGTIVYAGDSDFTSYSASTQALAGSLGWFDADSSAGGALTGSDNLYLMSGTAAASVSKLFPMHSVRLASGNAAGGFGTQISATSSDHVVISSQTAPVNIEAAGKMMRVDLGLAGDINDDCILADMDGGGQVTNFDIRLNACPNKGAGSLVGDSDTIEKSSAPKLALASRAVYADVNNNGRYDTGDAVYIIVTEFGAAATTLVTPNFDGVGHDGYSLRVTPAGGKLAGSIVYAGDSDLTAYGATVKPLGGAAGTARLAWFDADLTGTFTLGDTAYLVPATLAAGGVFPLSSVRLGGPTIVANPGAGTAPPPTTTSAPTTTAPPTTSAVPTTSAAPSTTSAPEQTEAPAPTGTDAPTATETQTPPGEEAEGEDADPENTVPGFGLMAVVAALGAALVAARRKL